MKKAKFAKVLSVIFALLMVFSAMSITVTAKTTTAQNIILMIGDGMGENSIEWTKSVYPGDYAVDTFPIKGYSKTNSYSGTTDSAAGGTALSSGKHAFNGNLGMLALAIGDAHIDFGTYMNTCEVAKKLGKKAGVVTSDSNSGATPAAFSTHVADRDYSDEITNQQLSGSLDLIWAKANGRVNETNAAENGWAFVDSIDDIKALEENTRSFGAFTGPIEYDYNDGSFVPLSKLTELAIDQLNNEKGFFLMVEGAHIDKNNHSNNSEGMMKSMLEFDKAIDIALDFAKEDGNTIVIVTADHETGGIKKNSDGSFKYTSGGHTSTNVPLRIYGADDFIENGETVVNYEISRYTAKKLGYTDEYPVFNFNKNFIIDFFKSILELNKFHPMQMPAV